MPERIVCIGDSISDGFTYQLMALHALEKAGKPTPTVINAGVSGDQAGGVLARLDRDVLPHKPALVTLMIGVNDSGYAASVESYESNVRGIVTRLRDKGVPVLIMTTTVFGENQSPERHERLARLNDILRRLAKEFGCKVAEVNRSMAQAVANGEKPLEPDGVHINFAGNRLIARVLLDALGFPDVPVPDTLKVEPLPGLVTPWKIKASEDPKFPETDEAAAALGPDASWKTLTLPMKDAQDHWWMEQERDRGFAVGLDRIAGKAPSYLGVATVESPRERKVYLNTGGHLQKVWLNGLRVYENRGWTGFHEGKERLPVTLKPGANRIVLQTNGSDFFFSLTENNDW